MLVMRLCKEKQKGLHCACIVCNDVQSSKASMGRNGAISGFDLRAAASCSLTGSPLAFRPLSERSEAGVHGWLR